MSRDKLVHMANQIATFFQSQPGDRAAQDVARHINNFWEPRMRRELLALIAEGGEGLSEPVLDAAAAIRPPPPA